MANDRSGRDYLERRSALAKRLADLPPLQRIQIIDDSQFDADVLASTFRKILGRDVEINTAKSLTTLHRQWQLAQPDLVFLDDRLGHISSATASIPSIRKLGYQGPIVVLSGVLTRQRRADLIRSGATDAIHKDDIDTLSVIAVLLRILVHQDPAAPPIS